MRTTASVNPNDAFVYEYWQMLSKTSRERAEEYRNQFAKASDEIENNEIKEVITTENKSDLDILREALKAKGVKSVHLYKTEESLVKKAKEIWILD